MRKVSVAEWVKALRSGKFPQGKTRLQTTVENRWWNQPEGFCCLGVYERLCTGEELSAEIQCQPCNTPTVRLLLDELGIVSLFRSQLTSENDAGTKFDRIADEIEAHIARNQEGKSK